MNYKWVGNLNKMSSLHGYSAEASKKKADYINNFMNSKVVDNWFNLRVGQTWYGKNKTIRYRVIELTQFEAVVYIYHRLNGKFNRLKKFRRNSAIFNSLA